jgi:hypothetical protein
VEPERNIFHAANQEELVDKATLLLSYQISNPLLTFKPLPSSAPHQWGLARGSQQGYSFAFAGVPLCDTSLHAFRLGDGALAFFGTIPQVDEEERATAAENWPQRDSLAAVLSATRFGESFQLISSERCYWVRAGAA